MSEFCEARDDDCDCGRNRIQILHCRKPFSPERMREIFNKMRERQDSLECDIQSLREDLTG